ncbi:AMP-binding protein [Xanthomonadaceae bacterium XH05]|nr:AMP-binding protein [Xanthomonadaceae bacterium XH05]
MADWLPLSRLMHEAIDARIVAREGPLREFSRWRQRVQVWRETFAQRPGHWAVYFEDAVEFAATLFGAWYAGVTVWLCGDNLPATLDALRDHVDGFAGDIPAEYTPLHPLTVLLPEADWPELDELATQLVVFTSGSTGTPTAITKTLAQLAREVESLEQCFGEILGDATIHGTVSQQHIYGLLFRVLWPLAAGRPIAARSFFHEDVVRALANDSSSVLISSPAHLKRMPDGLDWAQAASGLRAVFSSGGALPDTASIEVAYLLGCAPIEIYGSSETGGIAWRQGQNGHPGGWRPLPGVNWRITAGRLEVSSPHLPTQAWWCCEDQVEVRGDGFQLLGRVDRIVKIEERRVSLDALECALCELDVVSEARVLVVEGERVQLGAVVVPSASGQTTLDHLGRRAFAQVLSRSLARRQDAVTRPRRWRFVSALPLNAQGKVIQSALRLLFEEHVERIVRPPVVWRVVAPGRAEGRVVASSDLAAFEGHFPSVRILPGVAQLDWAIHLARDVFSMPPNVVRVDALKFQNVVRPGIELDLTVDWDEQNRQLTFCWQSVAGLHARGRILLGGGD